MADVARRHIDKMEEAAARAARWMVRHQRPDGAPPSATLVVESVYKGIWALTIAGYVEQADCLADWMKAFLSHDGDLPAPREEAAFHTGHYLYANGYTAIGARILGRFDLADPMIRFIATRQHPEIGGFFSHGPGIEVPRERMDSVSTSISIWAALFAGKLDVATRGAAFLERLFSAQPEPKRMFFSTVGVDGNHLREGLPGDSHAVIDVTDPEQDWYFIGLPSVVLGYLYRSTGEAKHLDLACAYLDYLDQSCDPGAFNDFSSGKSGVAAAHLHRLTGRPRYREIALHVADFILSKQTPWGYWCEHHEDGGAPPTTIAWSDMDMTLEYILWMKLMAQHLGH